MTETQPRLTLTPLEQPLPPNTHRAIANSIAMELRKGWRPNKGTRAIGNARTGRDYRTQNIPTPHPTLEVLWSQPYAWGVIDPSPALQIPMLAWHVLQLDAASALQSSHPEVDVFLRMRPKQGTPPLPFRTRPNRHGTDSLRRNSDYAPLPVAAALLAVATKATVWELDPHEVHDLLGEWDVIEASITLALAEQWEC